MPTLQQQITEKFLATLAESKDVDAEKIDQIPKPAQQQQKAEG